MSKNFDEVLNSGDEEAIEAALAEMETSGDILFADEEEFAALAISAVLTTEEAAPAEVKAEETNVVTPPKQEVAQESLTPEVETKQSGVREIDGKLYAEISSDNAVIESKNGKHHVPYDVLATARQQSYDAQAQLDALTQENTKLKTDFKETKRVSELYSKQLGDAGLDPKLLPEQMLNDPALMAQVKEDYPQIGELVEALAQQLPPKTEQVAAPQAEAPAEDPMTTVFNETAHLKTWMNEDQDRWDFAKQVDSKLADDPLYENKLAERLAEVERRTMAAFGDELTVEAQTPPKEVAKETPTPAAPIPNTPTDIGQQGSDTNAYTHILEQDAGEMTASMKGMTEAQIEAMLTDVSDFL